MKIPKGITKVITAPTFDGAIANCNRDTGLVVVLPEFYNLPEAHQFFILAHEAGHIVKKSNDEDVADSYAFEQYAKAGYPLSESIMALTHNLSFNSQDHTRRAETQLHRALVYDYKTNNNQKAKQMLGTNFNSLEGGYPISSWEFGAGLAANLFPGINQRTTDRQDSKNEERVVLANAELEKAQAGKAAANAAGENALANQLLAQAEILKAKLGGSGATKIILIVVALAVVAFGVWYFYFRKK